MRAKRMQKKEGKERKTERRKRKEKEAVPVARAEETRPAAPARKKLTNAKLVNAPAKKQPEPEAEVDR